MACSFIHADDGEDGDDRNNHGRGSGNKGNQGNEDDDRDRGPPGKVESFRRIAYFLIPDGGGVEIVAATPDGKKVLYADSGRSKIGIVDISKPWSPDLVREVDIDGVPTSVTVLPDGKHAIAAVNTSVFDELDPPVPPVIHPGRLVVDPASGHDRREVDILDEFMPFEKVDGLALSKSRRLWAVLDNEGGQIETRLVRVGSVLPGRRGLPRGLALGWGRD